MRDLSVLIASRNEEFLTRTVADVLEHSERDTDVIVILDGEWPMQGHELPQHARVTVVHVPEPIGQRAAINLAARISTARYVMKLDAHCSVEQGFDRVLIDAAQELGEHVTQIPAQKNLHAYDRVCAQGHRSHMGADDMPCNVCRGATTRDIVWKPRRGSHMNRWRLDKDLVYQGWNSPSAGPIIDTLSFLGACLFVSRAEYWRLGGFDESFGAWGQFGQEWACKTWLSGGRLVTNTGTWFAHMFRVGGIPVPYPEQWKARDHARATSQAYWRGNAWPGQTRTLRSLIEQFAPVPGWTQADIDALPHELPRPTALTKGVIWYSDCRPDADILRASQRSVEASGLPIVAVTLQPIQWPSARNIVMDAERGYLTMFRQILAGLEALDTDLVYFCEHDVIYAPEHFRHTPTDLSKVHYNQHVWKVDAKNGHGLHYRCNQTSGLCGDRRLLVTHYRERVRRVEAEGFHRSMGFEPGTHHRDERVDDLACETWFAEVPNIDIRHDLNLTASRWKKDEFRDQAFTAGWTESETIPGWGRFADVLARLVGDGVAV